MVQEIFKSKPSPLQKIEDYFLSLAEVELWIKRDDLLHPEVSGNKWRKLKYNLAEAEKSGKNTLLTFGGAYSNHLAATAAAGYQLGWKTIGMVRGERIEPLNPTLEYVKACGMELHFLKRSEYRSLTLPESIINLQKKASDYYILPEGGTNELALKGCSEIGYEISRQLDAGRLNYLIVGCGTGGTLAGITSGLAPNQQAVGISVLKGAFLSKKVEELLFEYFQKPLPNWKIIEDYHFGGYARFTPELIRFINTFKGKTGIPLDPIYTGKVLFGIYDLIEKGFFPKGSSIIAVHTGGLQGIAGFNQRFGKVLGAV